MTDYTRLIDAPTWVFIRETERFYPAGTAQRSVADQRDTYDAMCRHFDHGRPDDVAMTERCAGRVPLRHYARLRRNGRAVVLYFHGGGFVLGGLDSHDDICADICHLTGLDVVSVGYRLLPESRLADACLDGETALHWVRNRFGRPVILVGDSAGGHLAAALAHLNRASNDIAGQVLIYPGLGGDTNKGSYLTHANAPLLSREDVLFYGGLAGPDAGSAPLNTSDFTNLPPTLAISAECDPLADDARDYAAAINEAGGHAVWVLDKGLVHGHLRARHRAERARASFARILRAISLLGADKPLTRLAVTG